MDQQQPGDPTQGPGPAPSRPSPQAFPFNQPQYPQQPPAWGPPPWWYQPPRRRKAWLIWLISLLVAGGLMAYACAGLVTLIVGEGLNRPYQTQTLESGKADKVVAVVPLYGLVDGSMAKFAGRVLDDLAKDKKNVAVVLRVDTPGGTVAASDQINHAIRRFRSKTGRPVVVSQGGYATSGGYYISVAGDYIFAEPTTWTGNIGVIMTIFNAQQGLEDKLGVKPLVLTSHDTPYKDAPSLFKALTPEQEKYLRDLIETAYQQFVDAVIQGRAKSKLNSKTRQEVVALANGMVYPATQAEAEGLVDQIGYLPDAWEYAAKQARADGAKIVLYSPRPTSLADLLTGRAAPPALDKLNDPASQFRGLMAPQLLYLYHNQDIVQSWPTMDYSGP